MFKRIMTFLLFALIVIQFFHPKKNKAEGVQNNYVGNAYHVPEDVKSILTKACNDCHSNNTRYPWYSKIQPVDWWLNTHIVDGKEELNLDEYTNKSLRYQYHKMQSIVKQVKEGKMPLNSYTWVHKDAILSDTEKNTLIAWADAIQKTMQEEYPMDSLLRKK